MYKSLILPLCLVSLTALADSTQDSGCALGIQKLNANTLSFFYTAEAKSNTPYFYVKAVKEGDLAEQSLDTILNKGSNLVSVQNTKPTLYQIPEHSQKLYVVVANDSLTGAAPAAQVTPIIQDKANLKIAANRDVNIYPQELPELTHKATLVKNMPIYQKELTKENKNIKICELTL